MRDYELPAHETLEAEDQPSCICRWRERVRAKSLDTIHWFIGISAVSAAASTATTIIDRNPLSPMSAGMNGYDLGMGVAAHYSEKLEDRANEAPDTEALELRSKASRIREIAALGHIAVAGAGTAMAWQPGVAENPTVGSLLSTAAVAVVGGGVALKERHDFHRLGTPDKPNLAQRMGRRLLMTKFVEASAAITGLSAALATHSQLGPQAAAGATFVGVSAYMIAQARDERRNRRKLYADNIVPD